MVHTGEIPIIERVVSSVDGKTQVRLHASLPGFGTIGAAATTKKRALLGAKKEERMNECMNEFSLLVHEAVTKDKGARNNKIRFAVAFFVYRSTKDAINVVYSSL